ncbi:hypothetical protein YC2023_121466 [Brassica napus]
MHSLPEDKAYVYVCMGFTFGQSPFCSNKPLNDQVVRVIVIQKPLIEHAENLRQVKAVLEEGGNFSGIYKKVQLKPPKWDGEGEE